MTQLFFRYYYYCLRIYLLFIHSFIYFVFIVLLILCLYVVRLLSISFSLLMFSLHLCLFVPIHLCIFFLSSCLVSSSLTSYCQTLGSNLRLIFAFHDRFFLVVFTLSRKIVGFYLKLSHDIFDSIYSLP